MSSRESENNDGMEENMMLEMHFPTVKELISLVDICRGIYYERANLIVKYTYQYPTCCFVYNSSVEVEYSFFAIDNIIVKFENHNVQYLLFKYEFLPEIPNFKRNAIRAIDSAEAKGGSLKERLERISDVFIGKANILIHENTEEYGICTSSEDFYWHEKRGDLVYHIWINVKNE